MSPVTDKQHYEVSSNCHYVRGLVMMRKMMMMMTMTMQLM